jgi:hypothetical protein
MEQLTRIKLLSTMLYILTDLLKAFARQRLGKHAPACNYVIA